MMVIWLIEPSPGFEFGAIDASLQMLYPIELRGLCNPCFSGEVLGLNKF